MKLRFIVEASGIKTFTASHNVSNVQESDGFVNDFMGINKSLGRTKYSCFILYSDSNEIIKKY